MSAGSTVTLLGFDYQKQNTIAKALDTQLINCVPLAFSLLSNLIRGKDFFQGRLNSIGAQHHMESEGLLLIINDSLCEYS